MSSLHQEHVQAVFATSRCLLFRVEAPGLQCFLMCAHAPHACRPVEEIVVWWSSLTQLVEKHVRACCPLFVGIDANDRVGAVQSPAIGVHAPEDDNHTGEAFRTFWDAISLCTPSTFAGAEGQCAFHDPDAATWVSTHGTRHRIDYVLIPASWLSAVKQARTLPEFDAAGPVDHIAACLQVSVGFNAALDSRSFPRLPFRTVADVVQQGSDFAPTFKQALLIPWHRNVHKHVCEVDQAIWKACTARLTPHVHKRKPYTSDCAWQLLCAVRSQEGHENHSVLRHPTQEVPASLLRESVAGPCSGWQCAQAEPR